MQERASFDEYAGEYDNHFTYSNIGKLQRARVWHYLADFLDKPLNILEINCGTGYDALELAKRGHCVTATDASAGMIEVGKKRQANEPLKTKLYFEQAKFSELKDKLKGQKFDLVFSNFGGLNCIDKNEMKQLSADLAQLLTQDGKLFFIIMGRKCGWERMYFTLKGDKAKESRRSKQDGVDTTINNATFKTWYYSPKEIEEVFGENFSVEMVKPIGLFVPPSYLESYFAKHTIQLKILLAMENTLTASIFSNYADHFVIQLNRA